MIVAVMIVTRNRAGILPRAIESAMEQGYPLKEIHVLDDASEDGTADLAARFPGVRWERSDTRLGIPEARNRLMRASDAELVVGLDDDAWFLERDAVAAGVSAMATNPKIGALAFDVVARGRAERHGRREPQPWHAFQGCGHMLRMSAVREVGWYAPALGWYGSEEQDLSLRLLDAGHEVMLLAGVHVWHDKSATARDVASQHASGVCNDLALSLTRTPWPVVAWHCPTKVLSHLVFGLRHGLLRPCLRGMVDAMRRLPLIMQVRRPVRRSTWCEYRKRARRGPRPVVTDTMRSGAR